MHVQFDSQTTEPDLRYSYKEAGYFALSYLKNKITYECVGERVRVSLPLSA